MKCWLDLVTGVLLLGSLTAKAAPASPASELAQANTRFALDLYQQLKEKPGNLFFSPYSLSSALAMTAAGARENTAAQMSRVLHLEHLNDPHAAWAALTRDLNDIGKAGPARLSVANSLWPQEGYPFKPEYLKLVRGAYSADVQPCNYVRDSEAARRRINQWVEEQTNRKITELLSSGVLTPLTRLVLVNAIHFKGDWERSFPAAATKPAPFHLGNGQTVQAPLMTQKAHVGFADHADFQALSLDYKGGQLSMVFLLPKQPDGLPALEKRLTADNLQQWTGRLPRQEVTVFIPKFKMTSQFSLSDKLKALGMTDAFDMSRADFSGMDGRPANLHISAVVHKAVIEVNEEGAEAAAATAVVVGVRAVLGEPLVFRADRPFLFFIRDHRNGCLLFAGRMVNPTQ